MKPDAELAGYFAEAAAWDADRIAQARRTTRLALGVAGAGWVAVLALSAALMLLMPLKHGEPFNSSTADSDYEECGAFHTAARNQAWYALWNPNNPASPLNVHKDGSSVRAQVTSVSFFKRASGVVDLAQVRYVRVRRAAGGGVTEDTTHWIATLQYAYADPSTDPRVRRWNPLGFKVVDFKPEPEVLPEAPAGE